MTEKQTKKELEKMRRDLNLCGGDCRICPCLHCYTAFDPAPTWADCRTYTAFGYGCDLLNSEIFGALSNTARELHATAIEAVEWELEAIEQRVK